jgi:hypothetical protein
MRIKLKRTGGVAGIPREWELDEQTLSPQEAQELRNLLRRADFFALPSEVEGSGRARDAFRYELTVEEGERKHTVRCAEPEVPPPLRACIEWIVKTVR